MGRNRSRREIRLSQLLLELGFGVVVHMDFDRFCFDLAGEARERLPTELSPLNKVRVPRQMQVVIEPLRLIFVRLWRLTWLVGSSVHLFL